MSATLTVFVLLYRWETTSINSIDPNATLYSG